MEKKSRFTLNVCQTQNYLKTTRPASFKDIASSIKSWQEPHSQIPHIFFKKQQVAPENIIELRFS